MTEKVSTAGYPVLRPDACLPEEVKISVVIPAHNMGAFIVATLESVLAQSSAAHEIIVVDDGSTDDTETLLRPYAGRVRYHSLRPNQGVSKARNAGADLAAGNWILFLDGDDQLFPDAIRSWQEAAAKGGAGAVVGRVEQVDLVTGVRRERSFPGVAGEPPEPSRVNFWRSLIASPGAVIFHRDVHFRIGGFVRPWQPTEDRDYYIKAGVTTPFAFCERMVLQKAYRPDSSRLRSAIAVYWGVLVQIEFLDWCRDRGVATEFLATTRAAIVEHGLRRACKNRDGDVVRRIRDYAKAEGVPVALSVRLLSLLASAAGRVTGCLKKS